MSTALAAVSMLEPATRYRYKHLPTGHESAQTWDSDTACRLWLLTHSPRTEQDYAVIPVLEDSDHLTDAALDLLRLDGRYAECPGCGLLVHHSDRIAHAGPQGCPELRSLARARVSEGGAK